MAIQDDFSVAVNGDIRHTGGATNYTVLQLHRWLQDMADDQAASTGGNDLVDIVSNTPSERITDKIINLLGSYNIDDDAAQYLYAGSIQQASGGTLYAGLQILGAVNNSSTQITVLQDNAFYDSATAPFWGTQAGGGYNGNAAAGILARFLVKVRLGGFDLDSKKIRVQARHWGDTYDFFNVTMAAGENVAAISTVSDPQNDSVQGTVTAYTNVENSGTTVIDAQDETSYDNSPTTEGTFVGGSGHVAADVLTLEDGTTIAVDLTSGGAVTQFTVTNTASSGATATDTLDQISTTGTGTGFQLLPDTDNIAIDPDVPNGGYQLIDINDGSGDQPYYSKWTYTTDAQADQLKSVYEFTKELMETGTLKYSDGIHGAIVQGISHDITFDTKTGTFLHGERVIWGTHVWYDALAGGTFTEGNYVIFGTSGAAGKVVRDDGVDELFVVLEDITKTVVDDEVITEYVPSTGAASGVTAAVDTGAGGGSPVEDNDAEGGEGIILAYDDTDQIWVQLIHGAAPVNDNPIWGIRSGADCLVNTTIVARTVPKAGGFYGTFTGSTIGAYGIGVDPDDLSFPDTVTDLDDDTNPAPNNVTFTVGGLISGETYVLVGTKDLTPANDFDKDQLSLSVELTEATETDIVCTAAIPSDTPTSGTVRVQLDVGTYRRVAYTSYSGSTFTTASTSWVTPNDAAAANNIFISYIDLLATGTQESFTTVYSSDRSLWVRVRDGGTAGDNIPWKTFESQATLGSGGGSITAIEIQDA
jgi:hypothetical protein